PAGPVRAYTDQGRSVTGYQATIVPDRRHHAQQTLLRESGLADRVTMLRVGSQRCNCHGWVFADGRFFIKSDQIEAILHDNGYHPVNTPQPSDVAIYRQPDGQIIHSGIVRANGLGRVRVESKWGALGVFL